MSAGRWRVGRTLGRTLYLDDKCVGIIDTPELGADARGDEMEHQHEDWRWTVTWTIVTKFDRTAVALADRHYSRRKVGAPQFMPPGETLVLLAEDAVFGWWRPHPASGIRAMNGLDGWTCTIFRNESPMRSSDLVLAAESALAGTGKTCGPDGLLTYVWDRRIRSTNPGFCFKCAGWRGIGRSADGRKTLLQKRFALAGRLLPEAA